MPQISMVLSEMLLGQIKNFKKKNIKPEGFIVTKDKIFLSLNNC